MNHLLIVAGEGGIRQDLLQCLRAAGWRITVTAGIMAAKQLLQKGDIAGLMMEVNTDHGPERLKLLRFVQEFCPNKLVIMMHSGADASKKLIETLGTIGDSRTGAEPPVSLDLFRLSPAQKRIAILVAQAYPNREIARKLKIKEQSVRNELSRVFKKMGVWNRVELALLMRKAEGIISQNPREPWKAEFNPDPGFRTENVRI